MAKAKTEASRSRIALYHNKIKTDWEVSAARMRHLRLAKISGAIEVTL